MANSFISLCLRKTLIFPSFLNDNFMGYKILSFSSFFSFQSFTHFHTFLAYMVSGKKSTVVLMVVLFLFGLSGFHALILVFWILIDIPKCFVFVFVFILLSIFWASWICGFTYVINSGKLLTIFTSSIYSDLFFCVCIWCNIWYIKV